MTSVDALRVPRPATLQDVAARTLAGEPFDPLLREFLDAFTAQAPRPWRPAIRGAPACVDAIHDAYLAAVAEHLALVRTARPALGRRPGALPVGAIFRGRA
jgi:hypothetical protein